MAVSEELREIAARVRNWGRWGDDDQIGCRLQVRRIVGLHGLNAHLPHSVHETAFNFFGVRLQQPRHPL